MAVEHERAAPSHFDAAGVIYEFDGDVEVIRSLATLLSSAIPAYLAQLAAAADAGEQRRVAALAHTLRGSIGNIQATVLPGLTRELEHAARGGDPARPGLVEEIESEARILLSEFVLWAETLDGAANVDEDSQ